MKNMFQNINAKELAGLMTIVACFFFIGFAMYVEPTGEIHSSVNSLVIEMFSFAGVCFGIDYLAYRWMNPKRNNHKPKKPNKEDQS